MHDQRQLHPPVTICESTIGFHWFIVCLWKCPQWVMSGEIRELLSCDVALVGSAGWGRWSRGQARNTSPLHSKQTGASAHKKPPLSPWCSHLAPAKQTNDGISTLIIQHVIQTYAPFKSAHLNAGKWFICPNRISTNYIDSVIMDRHSCLILAYEENVKNITLTKNDYLVILTLSDTVETVKIT